MCLRNVDSKKNHAGSYPRLLRSTTWKQRILHNINCVSCEVSIGFLYLRRWQVFYIMEMKLNISRRMVSSGILRRVAFVRTDFSEELSASIIRVTRIGELGPLVVTSNRPSSNWSYICLHRIIWHAPSLCHHSTNITIVNTLSSFLLLLIM
jgi:hypothetical protein